jgi:hypothetical protein
MAPSQSYAEETALPIPQKAHRLLAFFHRFGKQFGMFGNFRKHLPNLFWLKSGKIPAVAQTSDKNERKNNYERSRNPVRHAPKLNACHSPAGVPDL